MKKLYVNPAAKTANMRIRTSLLTGSQTVDLNSKETVNGKPGDEDEADARIRIKASSLD